MIGHFFLLLLVSALAFDTGDHYEVTRSVCKKHGYSEDAQITVGLFNWYTDAFSVEGLGVTGLVKAHFDNLRDLSQVSSYWKHFTVNTKKVVEDAVRNNSKLNYLAAIGISFHALQDFYTHSNWAKLHPRSACNCLRTDTWYTRSGSTLPTATLSGLYDKIPCPAQGEDATNLGGKIVHGDYCGGENKDSFVRPLHTQAITHAYSAAYEWLSLINGWADAVDPTFRDFVGTYVTENAEDLADDLKYSLAISELVKTPDSIQDGHWKGYQSGDVSLFATASAAWAISRTIHGSVFRDDELHLQIFNNLYGYGGPQCQTIQDPTVPALSISPSASVAGQLALKIHVYSIDTSALFLDSPSPYVVITVDGISYRTSALQDYRDGTPDWQTIVFLDEGTTSVNIMFELRQLDSSLDPYESEPIAFFGSESTLNVTYNFADEKVTNSKGVNGKYASASQLLTIEGDRATLQFYFEKLTLGGCSGASVTCPGDKADTIVSRNNYCQQETHSHLICIQQTSGTPCRDELKTELGKIGLIDEVDIEIKGCSQACNGTRGVLYTVDVHSSNGATKDARADRVDAALLSNNVNGFTILAVSSASSSVLSFGLLLVLLSFFF